MMRGELYKHWQIGAAILFSVVIVVGAYVLARGIESPQSAMASEESALLQAIATRDSDTDGLPDWEESLYGTDPQVADTFKLGITDGEAVTKGLIVPRAIADVRTTSSTAIADANGLPTPAEGTLTALFAQNFFTLFVAAKQAADGEDLTESQMNDVANQSLSMLASTVKGTPDFKSASDLTVSESSPEAFLTFAADAEMVLLKNTNDATTTDLNYFKSAIMNGDTSAYAHIASIAKGYRGSAAGLAVLPVPKELLSADLLLINSLMRMSELDTDFTKADSDPLVAILALEQYQTVMTAVGKAFSDIGDAYAAAHLALPSSAPGAHFVNMKADIIRGQKSAKKL